MLRHSQLTEEEAAADPRKDGITKALGVNELALRQGSLDNITAVLISAPDTILGDEDDTEIPDKSVLERLNEP